MEEILGQEMRPPLSLAQFLADYKRELEKDFLPQSVADIQTAMRLFNEPERFEAAAKRCSLSHLEQPDDPRILEYVPGHTENIRTNTSGIPTAALKLKTFTSLLKAKETSTRNPYKRSREVFKLAPLPPKRDTDVPCDFYNDLVVSIRVYRPARATHIGKSLEKPVFAEEFECLGSNLLTELRDKISCVCNKKRFFDISENPTADLPDKDTDPGYFFITDTFYNDKRNPQNVDYSEVIRNWAKKAAGLKELNFKVASMEETRFLDLSVSLGFPQLYQHHGNCEHVFTFSQVELLRPGAPCSTRQQYPRLCSFGLFNTRLCNMCGARSYDFIVEHSDRQLHDPAYLCGKCFHSFHYVEGKKIGHFKAYKINDHGDIEFHKETEKDENDEDDEGEDAESVKDKPIESLKEEKETV